MKSINDLDRIDDAARLEVEGAVIACVRSGRFVLGNEVESFEREFAEYLGVGHCVGVANGTDALEFALKALGVAAGDLVATAANAGFYASSAILACGARPAYVDIDPGTYTMSPEELDRSWDPRLKAVIHTHLYGRTGRIDRIADICRERGAPLIEDCAQAHGARTAGARAGAIGACGCFSFYPTKNLGAMGDGGAIVTSDPRLDDAARRLRQYGWRAKYRVERAGGRNSRLDELQAAILRAKLPHLEDWNERRLAIAERYDRGIRNELIERRATGRDEGYVAHLYVIESDRRGELMEHLRGRGIPCDIHYPVPDHLQPVMAALAPRAWLPVTERAAERVLTLPCFPGMSEDECDSAIEAVNSWRPA